MDEMINHAESGVSTLDGLAAQARLLTQSIAFNYVQLGRVLCEAKALVKHGEWGIWLKDNAPVGERVAQNMIQVYKRFGNNPDMVQLNSSKLVKMLALPAGKEEDFADSHNLHGMSAREVESAVRASAGTMADVASTEAQQAVDTPEPAIPDEVLGRIREQDAKLKAYEKELQRIADVARDAGSQLNKVMTENSRLAKENRISSTMLEDAQASTKSAQEELLSMRSRLARGEVEHPRADALTPDVFASAVRQFMGTCQVMPHMGRAFSLMDADLLASFDANLRVVEAWAAKTREAMNVISGEVIEV